MLKNTRLYDKLDFVTKALQRNREKGCFQKYGRKYQNQRKIHKVYLTENDFLNLVVVNSIESVKQF